MKNIKHTFAILAIALLLTSCSGDDNNTANISGTGKLGIEFDNAFGNNDLILNSQANVTSQGETLKISTVKYIISNIVLTKSDGTAFTYPKSQSYFIVNEADAGSHVLELTDIPAGDYTKVKFGIGVDQAQFNLGVSGQGDFLAHAQAEGMLENWADGYRFLVFEGTFTSPTITADTPFIVRTGQTGTDYNYTEITLDLPSKALVRKTITPDIHIIADVSKIIDGTNKIKFTDNTAIGAGATITTGANLHLITTNLSGMFTVAHVHND